MGSFTYILQCGLRVDGLLREKTPDPPREHPFRGGVSRWAGEAAPAHVPMCGPLHLLGTARVASSPQHAPRNREGPPPQPLAHPAEPRGGRGVPFSRPMGSGSLAALGPHLMASLGVPSGLQFIFHRFSGPRLFPHTKKGKTRQNKNISLCGCGKRIRPKIS